MPQKRNTGWTSNIRQGFGLPQSEIETVEEDVPTTSIEPFTPPLNAPEHRANDTLESLNQVKSKQVERLDYSEVRSPAPARSKPSTNAPTMADPEEKTTFYPKRSTVLWLDELAMQYRKATGVRRFNRNDVLDLLAKHVTIETLLDQATE